MGALKALALGAVLVVADPVRADPVDRWQSYIAEASLRFGIPVAWIERVMRAESGGRTMIGGRPVVSPAGAMGLMQLMPATWAAMREAYRLGDDPHDPHDNIVAGTAWLRAMYDRYGYPGLFAAYNAGAGRYDEWLARGRALPAETRSYLASVTGRAPAGPISGHSAGAVSERADLFAVEAAAAPSAGPAAAPALFAIRR